MPRKIIHGGRVWNRRLAELVAYWLIVRVCEDCGSPVADGYVCIFCSGETIVEDFED